MAQKFEALFSLLGLDVQRKVVQVVVLPSFHCIHPRCLMAQDSCTASHITRPCKAGRRQKLSSVCLLAPLPCRELFRKLCPVTPFLTSSARTMAHSIIHKRSREIEWFNVYLFMFGTLRLLSDTILLMIEKAVES